MSDLKTVTITIKDQEDGSLNAHTALGMGRDNFTLADDDVTMAVRSGIALMKMQNFHPEGIIILAMQLEKGDLQGCLQTCAQLIEDAGTDVTNED